MTCAVEDLIDHSVPAARERASALDGAENRLRDLIGVVNAATAEIVGVLADVLEGDLWSGPGWRSFEHWISWRCGVSAGRAGRLAMLARRAAELPETMSVFRKGRLTEDQVAVIARHAPADRDGEAAELAVELLVPQLERVLRVMPSRTEPEPAAPPSPPPELPPTRFGTGDTGEWWLRLHLDADEGALFQLALERARDSLFHERHPETRDLDGRIQQISWADAAVCLARAGLDALDPQSAAGRHPSDRYRVLLHVDGTGGQSHLHLGPDVPDSLRRHLTCDASVRAVLEQFGIPVGVTVPFRTVDDKLRVLVEERDRGCRVPGCAQTRWLHVHHIVHREDGGETSYRNCCCVCPYHHRLHHRGLLGISGDPTTPEGLVFTDHRGRVIRRDPPSPGVTGARAFAGVAHEAYRPPSGERLDAWAIYWPWAGSGGSP